MFLVASAKPRAEPQLEPDQVQLLEEADTVIVSALFDDIVRHLTTRVADREPELNARSAPPPELDDDSSVWTPSPRVHPGRSRSPPLTRAMNEAVPDLLAPLRSYRATRWPRQISSSEMFSLYQRCCS
jgi:hypothetical protein